MRPLSIYVLVDALGWEIVRRRSFLDDLLVDRRWLTTILGYSSGAIPTVLSGLEPAQHGHWNLLYHAPATSPFGWMRPLARLPRPLVENRLARKGLKILARRRSGYRGYFSLYDYPVAHLPFFDLTEKRDIYQPGGLDCPSIFDAFEQLGITWEGYNYHAHTDEQILELAPARAAATGARVLFLYLSGLDHYLHWHIDDEAGVDAKVAWYARGLRRVVDAATRAGRDVRLFVFSDHGMTPVRWTHDLRRDVQQLGLRVPDDYLPAYDSTMARFWVWSARAREQLTALLSDHPCGQLLPETELRRLGVWFDDGRYYHLLFLMRPGMLLSPSDMGTARFAGMHGYHPSEPTADAVLLSSVPVERAVDRITDVHDVLLADLGVTRRPDEHVERPWPPRAPIAPVVANGSSNGAHAQSPHAAHVVHGAATAVADDVDARAPAVARPVRTTGLLFVLTSPVRGGIEEVVLRLLQRLDPAEFRLGLAAPQALLDAFGPELAGAGVAAHAAAAESWLRPAEVGRLAEVIRRFEPDLVNAHLFRAVAVAAPLARLLGVPAVVETYHGREGWRRGFVRGSFAVDRAVVRCADQVIAVSQAAREFLVGNKGYPARKVVVVPNGRDLSVFRPGRDGAEVRRGLGIPPKAPVVGVVGRLDRQKGHAYLLDAWPLVAREFPAARLLVVGDGALRGELEQRAREGGVGASVVFTGFRADVPRVLDAIDMLVLPSLYEGMPLTAIEASAMARPVVATAVDGTPEVVRDGHTGFLVPPANPSALARAILGLLHDPARAQRLGEAGRAHVLEHFDLDRHVDATARVYRTALRRAR